MALQIDPSDFALLDRNENITGAIKNKVYFQRLPTSKIFFIRFFLKVIAIY